MKLVLGWHGNSKSSKEGRRCPGGKTDSGCAMVRAKEDACLGRSSFASHTSKCLPLVCCLESSGKARPQGCRKVRSSPEADAATIASFGVRVDARRPSSWIYHRTLDAQAYNTLGPETFSRVVSPQSCVATPARIGMELPAACTPCTRTRRGGHPTLGAVSLAAYQKKARLRRALLIFLDESGFSQCPSVRRTWGRRGETPVITVPFNWKRMSAIASLITTPRARGVGLCLRLVRGNVNHRVMRRYLSELKRHCRGRQVILLWDRLPVHRSRHVQNFLDRQRHWLTTEYLPPYAPELNPVENLWSFISGDENVANGAGENMDQVRHQVRGAAAKARRKPALGRSFLKHCGLF